MLYYILTVIIGFLLDFFHSKNSKVRGVRVLFIAWLFVFLCFGYMTGSDWRSYELEFSAMNYLSDTPWANEVGFNLLFWGGKKIFGDYWLVVGILKSCYLFTLIRVIKIITPYWLSVISLLITGSLSFLLIDNPLRFMTALIIVNVVMECSLKKKRGWAFAFAILSFFIHNASIFFIILIPFLKYADRIAGWNKVLVAVMYLFVLALSSSIQAIESLRLMMVYLAIRFSGGISTYSHYSVSSNASFFTIGNMMSIVMFFIVLYTRDMVVNRSQYGRIIYGMTIAFTILSRLFLIIPTGFRLAIPFGIFYMVYMVYLIRSKNVLKWIFIAYTSLSFPLNLWNTYKFIPYSNSIPYILTEHTDYYLRSNYNIEAYEERTGKVYDGVYSE